MPEAPTPRLSFMQRLSVQRSRRPKALRAAATRAISVLAAAMLLLGLVSAVVAASSKPASAQGTTSLYVDANSGTDGTNTCTDPANPCQTLQYAVTQGESSAYNGDLVDIDLNPGTYGAATINLGLNGNTTEVMDIVGSGASDTTVDGDGASSDIVVDAGSSVTISDLTITDGTANNGGGVDNLGAAELDRVVLSNDLGKAGGGAIANGAAGLLRLNESTVTGDTSDGPGGGVYNLGIAALNSDTFVNDTSTAGGGFYDANQDMQVTTSITNTTFTGDSSSTLGGAFENSIGTVDLTDDTFVGNTAVTASGGAGVTGFEGAVHMADSLLADNTIAGPAGNTSDNCGRGIGDSGFNVADDSTCSFGTSSLVSTAAAIWAPATTPPALAANGSAGPDTIAITGESSAYQLVAPSACTVTSDERSEPRPGVSGRQQNCDAGAYEVQTPLPLVTCTSDPNVFNTGYDSSTGGVLSSGALDANWQVAGPFDTPSGTSPPSEAVPLPSGAQFSAAYVSDTNGAYVTSPYGNATWISQTVSTQQSVSDGDWYYEYQFSLDPSVDPSTFALTMDFLADNEIAEVYVNGVAQSSLTTGLPQDQGATNPYGYRGFYPASAAAQTTLNHDWVTGPNTIVVQMKSGSPDEAFDAQLRPSALCPVDLSVTKSASPDPYAAGQPLTYTVTVSNAGPGNASGVTVSDPLPAALSSAGFTWTCSATSGSSCAASGVGSIDDTVEVAAGGTLTYSVTGTVPANTTGDLSNTATVTPAQGTSDANCSPDCSATNDDPIAVPFTCSASTIFLGQGSPTQLNTEAYGAGTTSFTPVGQAGGGGGWIYNALGYDTADNFLYATGDLRQVGVEGGQLGELLRIDSTGAATPIAPVSVDGTPIGNAMIAAAFDSAGSADAGTYYAMHIVSTANATVNDDTLFKVNVTTGDAVEVPLTVDGQPYNDNLEDFTFADGYLWGVDTGQGDAYIDRIDPATGDVTLVPQNVLPTTGTSATYTYGADWTYGNGNLGFSNNQDGDVYQVAVSDPAGQPTFSLVSSAQGPSTNNNDGAACTGQPADLSISKSGPSSVLEGGTVTYTVTVTDNGPGDSSGFSVDDPLPAGITAVSVTSDASTQADPSGGCTVSNDAASANDVNCVEGPLANGASFVITITGTAPDSTGDLVNTATVTGLDAETDGCGPTTDPACNNSSSVTTAVNSASLDIAKSADVNAFTAAGQTINYTYVVTNTGSATLSNISVSDDLIASVDCPETTLAGGDSEMCTGSYTTTATDISNGSVTNSATASGDACQVAVNVIRAGSVGSGPDGVNGPDGPDGQSCSVTSAAAAVTVPYAALSLAKSAEVSAFTAAGQSIDYSYLVTNIGQTTISNISVSDSLIASVDCPQSSLDPGASEICTGSYTTTANDVSSGSVTNTATASGSVCPAKARTASSGGQPSCTVSSGSSSVTVPLAALSVAKTANVSSFTAAGQTIDYSYLVTNIGQTALSNISVSDSLIASVNCTQSTLAPGNSETCTGSYTTTATDVASGSVTNTATAGGNFCPPGSPKQIWPTVANCTVSSSSTSVTVPLAALKVVKSSATRNYSKVGDIVSYRFLVTNIGEATLSGIRVHDTEVAPATQANLSAISCPAATLRGGTSETCTASYTVTKADLDHGSVTDSATASGMPAGSKTPIASGSSSAKVPAFYAVVTLTKSASTLTPGVTGDDTFILKASNSGPSPTGKVVVTDVLATGLVYVASTASTGTVAVAGQKVTWTIPNLAPSGLASSTGLEILVKVETPATVTNTATFKETTPDGSGGTTGSSNTVTLTPVSLLNGYRIEGGDGGLFAFHLPFYRSVPPPTPSGLGLHIFDFVAQAAISNGYWLVERDGGVFAFGGAHFFGSLPQRGIRVDDIVGVAATPDGRGYWMVTSRGVVYGFGDASAAIGSLAGKGVTDIVAISSAGAGSYWLVGSDGQVYAFGHAVFHGSCTHAGSGCEGLDNIVGIANNGPGGYWLTGRDGGVFGFGTAHYFGSCPQAASKCHQVRDVVGIARADAKGYWLAEADGQVLPFGDAHFYGRCGITGTTCVPLVRPIVAITS